jgi:hypothetical protein
MMVGEIFWGSQEKKFFKLNSFYTFAPGEMAERSIAAVLKTVDC